MSDPDQLRRANCERIVLRFQSFYCFMNRTLEASLFEMPADVVLKRIEERTNQFNRNRQRGGGVAVWMYEFGNELAFLIRFGGSLKRDEVMDNDKCRPDIRRPVGYDLVVYNIETGEQWDEEKVLMGIRQLIHKMPTQRIRYVDSKLASAAECRVGSIRKAVEVAQSQTLARKSRLAQ